MQVNINPSVLNSFNSGSEAKRKNFLHPFLDKTNSLALEYLPFIYFIVELYPFFFLSFFCCSMYDERNLSMPFVLFIPRS